jgi:hypothetical protein
MYGRIRENPQNYLDQGDLPSIIGVAVESRRNATDRFGGSHALLASCGGCYYS